MNAMKRILMSKVKAFGYLKLSGMGSNGREQKEVAMKRWADAKQIEIVKFYEEKERSQDVFSKFALSTLLTDLEDNNQGIKTLVVEKLDQLAQDLTVQSVIIWDLRSQGFEVVSALEGRLWNTCNLFLLQDKTSKKGSYEKRKKGGRPSISIGCR
jgi:DNA invertase Pin-like site-specific DNA recombinase